MSVRWRARIVSTTVLVLSLACTSPGRAAPVPGQAAPTPAPAAARPAATSAPPTAARPDAPSPGGPRAAPRPRPTRSPIGTNLTMLKPWSGEWVFKDAFHTAMPWRAESQPGVADSRPLALDKAGWITKLEPGQRGIVRFFISEEPTIYPKGLYTVLWDGRGRIEVESVRNVAGRQANSLSLLLDPKDGAFGLAVTATDPADYVRNIRVIMPGGTCVDDDHKWCADDAACGGRSCVPFAATIKEQPYHPDFLHNMEPYSTLRFMFWNETIGTTVSKWDERVPADAGLYSAYGAPYEVMIQLANHMRTDMWITIPLRADDDFVQRLAELLKTTLDPELRIYLEYSNEVWNGAFPMAMETRAKGVAAKLDENPFRAQMAMYARRSTQIFDIWTKVFEGNPRVVKVLAGQNDGYAAARFALEFDKTYEKIDALAIAPYFGAGAGTPLSFPRLQGITAQKLLDDAETIMLPEAIAGMKAHADMVAEYGKKRGRPIELIAYEGGQHFIGIDFVQNDAAARALFRAANHHPKMRDLYLKYLAAWRAHGGHVFVHFVHTNIPSKWGNFGLIDNPLQTRKDSPKLDGVLTFIEQNPTWW